jgi:hypothetical protein
MAKENGNSLNQYVIIIALIVVALIPVFFLLGSTISGHFSYFLEIFSNKQDNTTSKDLTSNPPSDSVNPSNPSDSQLQNCVNGECEITLGDYILTGIPENFNSVVRTSGPSGGTEKISDLIAQIAKQLEDKGKFEEARIIKSLSNSGHNLAILQNELEAMVESCNNDAECIKSYTKQTIQKPQTLIDTGYEFPGEMTYQQLAMMGCLGYSQNCINKPNTGDCKLSYFNENSFGQHMVKQYLSIQEDTNIDKTTKNIIKELYWDIGVIGEDMENMMNDIMLEKTSHSFWDPLELSSSSFQSPSDPVAMFQDYSASKVTHFDSGLICATGSFRDSGQKCH